MTQHLHHGHRSRMMDKLNVAPGILTDCEILEIALFTALPRVNTNPTAHELLYKFGTLDGVLSAPKEELLTVAGVGESVVRFLQLLRQISMRTDLKPEAVTPRKFTFAGVKEYFRAHFKSKDSEEFLVLFIDKQDNIIKAETCAYGTRSGVEIDLTGIAREISACRPYAMIVAHNHPSGLAQPSAEDDTLTAKLAFMLNISGVRLYDHVIVGDNEFFSYHMTARLDQIRKTTTENMVSVADVLKTTDLQ